VPAKPHTVFLERLYLTTMAANEDKNSISSFKLDSSTVLGIFLVSAVYFADIFLKASRKLFWFDELFAVHLCRLPTFRETWSAVTHGADFNPPLFYLLTRLAQHLFGNGLIATRLPEIFGVWLFCICLFLFVARRAGAVSGFIAAAFPFFTLAGYYAYEARAHGMILGWCGLTLVCWQRHTEGRAKYLWLAGFGLSLAGALLTHVYAVYLLVPFATVELYNLLNEGRLDWGIVTVMASVSASVILLVYLPLLRAYRLNVPAPSSAAHDTLQRFLVDVIGPALMILLLWLLISALSGKTPPNHQVNAITAIPQREILLALGFVFTPLIGVIGCKISGGPFFDRYFLPSVAGYAILLGFVSSGRQVSSWAPQALAACMFLFMIGDLGSIVYFRMNHRIFLIEPSSGFRLSTNPAAPMELYSTVLEDHGGLDILVLPAVEYLYFFTYAPPAVVSHLSFGAQADALFFTAFKRLASGARVDLKITAFGPFLAAHDHFLVYESREQSHMDAVQAIATAGYRLISARDDTFGIMYEYAK
jgi:Dolichyl-phosphate-mannose-protein mannosyltransferase